jgi:UDP-3-O-[3-hydroxymyristoyl] N-acetylglucosamine deacetylase
MKRYQHTLKKSVRIAGVGLHSGEKVTLQIKPAYENAGISFVRKSETGKNVKIPAFMGNVSDTRLATTLSFNDTSVSTVEHLLAALTGLEIDNAIIEIDGCEVPILDGSAALFVQMLHKAGKIRQKAPRRIIKIQKKVAWEDGDRSVTVFPYNGFKVTCEIDFPHEVIKSQRYTVKITQGAFIDEIAPARTFGFLEEIEQLRQNGLALGGSLENAVVVSRFGGILNKDGLRFTDEFVRHKALDLLGDLSLLGCPLQGHVVARKAGHCQHFQFMRLLAHASDCWDYVSLQEEGAVRVISRESFYSNTSSRKIWPFLLPLPLAGESCHL